MIAHRVVGLVATFSVRAVTITRRQAVAVFCAGRPKGATSPEDAGRSRPCLTEADRMPPFPRESPLSPLRAPVKKRLSARTAGRSSHNRFFRCDRFNAVSVRQAYRVKSGRTGNELSCSPHGPACSAMTDPVSCFRPASRTGLWRAVFGASERLPRWFPLKGLAAFHFCEKAPRQNAAIRPMPYGKNRGGPGVAHCRRVL